MYVCIYITSLSLYIYIYIYVSNVRLICSNGHDLEPIHYIILNLGSS